MLELRRFLDSFWDEGLLSVKQAVESSSGTEPAMTTAPPDIVREVVIAAPPEVVFPYFTEPEKMIVVEGGRPRPSTRDRAASSRST